MLLHYFNTPPEVLGQWYTHHLQHECIFESGWAGIKNPSKLYFKTFNDKDHEHVSDVSFLPYRIEDGPYHILHVEELSLRPVLIIVANRVNSILHGGSQNSMM